MKRCSLVLIAAIVVATPLAGFADVSEKTADTQDYTMPEGSRSDTTAGDIDGTNTFDRVYSVNYDGTCSATSTDSGNDGVGYEVFAFHSPATENLDALVTLGTLGDSVMFVYCDPFDPLNPAANLLAWDDDGGAGLASAITPADGYSITADTTYYMVISGYSSSHLGTYTLDLGGSFVFGVAQLPTPTPIPGDRPIPTLGRSGMIAMVLLLACAAFLFLRRRVA